MIDYLALQLNQTPAYLLAEKGLFLPLSRTLVLADLHLGKAAHFRKSGIMIPAQAGTHQDYQNLHRLILKYNPLRIIFLGDLFHSVENASWQYFIAFAQQYPQLQLSLIRGNHDILPRIRYNEANLLIYEDQLAEGDLIFSHAPLNEVPSGTLNMAGHIHPAATLKGAAKQSLQLPCFHFEPPYLLLPAFGSLTGTYILPKGRGKQFVVTGKMVKEI